jgi:hypothetical protein
MARLGLRRVWLGHDVCFRIDGHPSLGVRSKATPIDQFAFGAHDILVSLHSNRASRRPVPISARDRPPFFARARVSRIRLPPSDTDAASLCTAIYYEFLLRLGKHRAYFKVVLHSPSLKTRVRGRRVWICYPRRREPEQRERRVAVDRKRSSRRERYDNNEEGICPS